MTSAPQLRRSGNAQAPSVAEHIASVAAPLLGVPPDDVRAALSAEAAHIQLSAFADSTHAPVLVVAAAPSKPLTITLEARYADEFTSQVAFAKRAPASALSAARPLWQQLSVVALGAGSPVDALAAVLPSALAPLLKSAEPLAAQTDADRASLRARLDELQRALHRCQQRVEMPELELRVPAAVADAVAAAPTDRGGGEARAAALARDELERRGELGAALEEVERLMPRRLEELGRLAALPDERAAELAEGTAEHIVQFWQRYEEHTAMAAARVGAADAQLCALLLKGDPDGSPSVCSLSLKRRKRR